MITPAFNERLLGEMRATREQGLYKVEHPIAGEQGAWVRLADGRRVLNMCANNYLNLSSHPDVVAAAARALEEWGYGMSSVRFICGTQTVHAQLEETLARFLGMEAAILYSSCFDANGGLFETLLGAEDAVVSDALNHASVIDGIRLCKAQRLRYRNCDMADLEDKLKESREARTVMIATDGVFSMDGVIAPLADICALAEKCGALVMVDDSHGLGVLGEHGRRTPEHFRAAVEAAGFATRGAGHPIVPVMVGEAQDAQRIAAGLFERGVYAVGFFYPVVPRGEARIRFQVAALHETADLDFAVEQLVAARDAAPTG